MILNTLKSWWAKRSTSTLYNPQPWLRQALQLSDTDAGVAVSGNSSLHSTAVFACVRVLSEGVASLPLHVYRRSGEDTACATDHPLYRVLHFRPNPLQTSYDWRALNMTWLLLHGNSYNEIIRDKAGNVTELWPLRPDRMILRLLDGKLVYNYAVPGGDILPLRAEDVLHLKGLSTDGLVGMSPISAAKQSIGLSMAAEKFGAMYFGHGSRVGGVIEVPNVIGNTSALRESWETKHDGIENAHKIAILQGGMKFTPFAINNEEAQWLESRRFGVEDICRIFRVPPHMVADLSKANYSNVDALTRDFTQHSLTPWLTNMEQAYAMKLLKPAEWEGCYVEHDLTRTLRGDHEARMRGYQAGIYAGIYSPNDCRRFENLNPREGGEVYLQPVNLAPSPFTPAAPQQGVQ